LLQQTIVFHSKRLSRKLFSTANERILWKTKLEVCVTAEEIRAMGAMLADLRSARGMSLAELEKASGVSKGYLSQLERGEAGNPSLETIASLAEALGIRLEIRGDDPEQKAEHWTDVEIDAVGETLRTLRKGAKISEESLANENDVSRTALRNLEQGYPKVQWSTVMGVSRALGAKLRFTRSPDRTTELRDYIQENSQRLPLSLTALLETEIEVYQSEQHKPLNERGDRPLRQPADVERVMYTYFRSGADEPTAADWRARFDLVAAAYRIKAKHPKNWTK